MIGKNFIERTIHKLIVPIVNKYVDGDESRKKCADSLTQLVMDFVDLVGYREFIKILWYAKRQWNIQRFVNVDPTFTKQGPTNALNIAPTILSSDD